MYLIFLYKNYWFWYQFIINVFDYQIIFAISPSLLLVYSQPNQQKMILAKKDFQVDMKKLSNLIKRRKVYGDITQVEEF